MNHTATNVVTPVKTEERAKLGIRPGDTVRVHQKIVEKGKTRVQTFEGLVLATKHGREAGATFTVRAMMSGVGVERIFPLYAPFIEKIEITRRSSVRRAKLYFIREKVAREVRRQLRNMRMVKLSTDDFAEEEEVVTTDELDENAVVTEAAPIENVEETEEVVEAPAEESVVEAVSVEENTDAEEQLPEDAA